MIDKALIAELYVIPTADTKELYKALRFRVPTHELPQPIRRESVNPRQGTLLLRRTPRYWQTRLPPISLPKYKPNALTGDAKVLQERIDELKKACPHLEEVLLWWTNLKHR